ncbi:hypothetical protein PSPO01_13238 [Paraphaeosphaeria sporulosa]
MVRRRFDTYRWFLGVSGPRKGCFGGIITGDTGLACHGANGDKSLVQTTLCGSIRGILRNDGGAAWHRPRCGRDDYQHLFGRARASRASRKT